MLRKSKYYKGSLKPDDPIFSASYVIGNPQPMVSHPAMQTPQQKAIYANTVDGNATQGAKKSTPATLKPETPAASETSSSAEQLRHIQNKNFADMIMQQALSNLKAAAAKAEEKSNKPKVITRGTIGNKTLREKNCVIRPAEKDAPIYKQGWIITTNPDGTKDNESCQVESLIARLRDDSEWEQMSPEQLVNLLADGLIFYGGSGDVNMVKYLTPLYLRVKQDCEIAQRRKIFERIGETCDQHPDWFNALFSFLLLDDDRVIVSTAALDLATYIPGGSDGLDGVRGLVGHIQRGEVDNRGAAFGGLLFLGDARVYELLKSLRKELTDEEVREAMKCRTGYMFDATLDFLIEWLESLIGDRNDAKFGEIASALFMMTEKPVMTAVQTLKRNFGARGAEPRISLIDSVPMEEFGRQRAALLYSLEARETAPKVMSTVLRAWGLSPRAAKSQQALPPN